MLLLVVFFNVLLARQLLGLGKALGVHSSHGESPSLQNLCCSHDCSLELLISGKPEMLGVFFRSDQLDFPFLKF